MLGMCLRPQSAGGVGEGDPGTPRKAGVEE